MRSPCRPRMDSRGSGGMSLGAPLAPARPVCRAVLQRMTSSRKRLKGHKTSYDAIALLIRRDRRRPLLRSLLVRDKALFPSRF